MAGFLTALRLLSAAPQAAKLLRALDSARKGDMAAAGYLRSEGWADALDVAFHPGAGEIGRRAVDGVRGAISEMANPQTIDGVWREIDPTPPWSGFLHRMLAQPYGAHIILGPVGSGKTQLAIKLAKRYAEEHGYKTEAVAMYGADVPPFAVTISKDTLLKRMQRLGRWLDSQSEDDEEDDEGEAEGTEPKADDRRPTSPPPGDRVIIIDEASLSLSNNPNDPGRRAAIQALTQSRHLSWVVFFIAQWSGLLPLSLLGQTTVWVKSPDGREAYTDRDNPAVRDLWERAAEAFAGLKQSGWYQEPWLDKRAWAFCDAPPIGSHAGYTGLIPFTPAVADQTPGETA